MTGNQYVGERLQPREGIVLNEFGGQILEEQVQELVPAKGELEIIVPLAIVGALLAAAFSLAALGLPDTVAGREFLVSAQHALPEAALAAMAEAWFVDGAGRDGYRLARIHVRSWC